MKQSNIQRRLEKRLETGLKLRSFLDAALETAGTYCAFAVLRDEDHDDRIPTDRLKRIPLTRAEVSMNEGEGAEMRVAAMSAIELYISQNEITSGWFTHAYKAAKHAARMVFQAGYATQFEPEQKEESSFEDTHYGMSPQEYRNWKRFREGKPAPELKDEERHYRSRLEGKFYVNDAVVKERDSSIQHISAPTTKSNSKDRANDLAYAAILRAEMKYGEGYADKLDKEFTKMLREGAYASVVELAYTI